MSEPALSTVSALRPAKRAPLPQAPRVFDKIDVVPSSSALKEHLAVLQSRYEGADAAALLEGTIDRKSVV